MVAGSFSLKFASVSASISISDTFFITTALLFGPAPATLADGARHASSPRGAAGTHRDRVCVQHGHARARIWAGAMCSSCSRACRRSAGADSPIGQLIVPLLALTTVYFVLNSGLIAVAIGLDARQSPLDVWREHFLWLSVNYFAAASVAFCLILLIHQASLMRRSSCCRCSLCFTSRCGRRSAASRMRSSISRISIVCICRQSRRSRWRSTPKTT